MKKYDTLKELIKQKNNLEKKLNNKINIKDIIMTLTIKSGIALNYTMPYILSLLISFSILKYQLDDIKEEINSNYLTYTTKWEYRNEINDFYERTETTYKITDDNYKTMNPDELADHYFIINQKVTYTNEINEKNEEEIIIGNVELIKNRFLREILKYNLELNILTIFIGNILNKTYKYITKEYIRNILLKLLPNYTIKNNNNFYLLKDSLKLKENNIDLLTKDNNYKKPKILSKELKSEK